MSSTVPGNSGEADSNGQNSNGQNSSAQDSSPQDNSAQDKGARGTEGAGRANRRGRLILLSLLGAAGALGAATQTWVHVRLAGGDVQVPDIDVAGNDAATGVTALALVAMAAAVALSVGGRIARTVVAVLLALAGAGITATSLFAAADPAGAAAGVVGKATGMAAAPGEYTATAMPYLAAAAGLWILACAVVVLVAGRHWTVSRRYETGTAADSQGPAGTAPPRDSIDSWDRLTRGEDPTG